MMLLQKLNPKWGKTPCIIYDSTIKLGGFIITTVQDITRISCYLTEDLFKHVNQRMVMLKTFGFQLVCVGILASLVTASEADDSKR